VTRRAASQGIRERQAGFTEPALFLGAQKPSNGTRVFRRTPDAAQWMLCDETPLNGLRQARLQGREIAIHGTWAQTDDTRIAVGRSVLRSFRANPQENE